MRISDWSSDVCSSDLVAGVSHKGRVEISSIGLHLLGDGYYGIYQNSRDGDTAWTQNSGCNHFPHLCNNFSSAVVSSKCNRVAIKVSRFVFEGDISRRIRVGASDEDRKRTRLNSSH